MPHLGHGLYFPMESIEHSRFFFRIVLKALEQLFRNDFDGHIPVEIKLVCTVDFAHPAFADALDQYPFFIDDASGFKQRIQIRLIHSMTLTSQAIYQSNFIHSNTLCTGWEGALSFLSSYRR